MYPFIITVHVIVSVFLIFVILLQPGKGDAMAAFAGGGGSSNTVFGGRGSVTFLSKVTAVCARVAPLVQDCKIEFDAKVSTPAFIEGDPVALQQILFNLITNALRYSFASAILMNCALSPLFLRMLLSLPNLLRGKIPFGRSPS